ncbi:Rieske (2Fe-2S) protein [Roseomonas sp. GCM10028921]
MAERAAGALGLLKNFAGGAASPVSTVLNGRETLLLVVRMAPQLYVHIDLCPHQDLPLTWRGRCVLSSDGRRLRCSSHGAKFAVNDGRALGGPGDGCGRRRCHSKSMRLA